MSRASETFHAQPWGHNCAQAVAYKWSSLYKNSDTVVAEYKLYGGGRAEGGMCGALFAAVTAVPGHREEIIKEFVEKVGAERCMDIKGAAKTPCPLCVDIADELVEKYAKK